MTTVYTTSKYLVWVAHLVVCRTTGNFVARVCGKSLTNVTVVVIG
jgi:hypothetical protein